MGKEELGELDKKKREGGGNLYTKKKNPHTRQIPVKRTSHGGGEIPAGN